jgi:hypothetical protein
MSRELRLPRPLAQTLFATAVALTLGATPNLAAQSATTSADAAAATASPSDQPRRGRDRRRNSEQRPASDAAAQTASSAAIADTDETVEATVVCKNIKLTGTKVARRICGTPEQWAAMQKRTNDAAEETMRQARDRQSTITQPPTQALAPAN